MSALVPVIHSPLTVFTVWEIGHDPDTKGEHDDARTGSAQVHSRTYRWASQAACGRNAAGAYDAPGAPAGPAITTTRSSRANLNTPAAKGRVERAHQTLQDRLVKELRLQRISTVDAANEFMPTFIEDYNRRFGKLPRDRHDAHRTVRKDEDLAAIFAWREYRKVTESLKGRSGHFYLGAN